ncbi:MAG: hypothetical protein ACKPKO_31855, partial [Candidatus Fonsibacter sp.]
MKSKDEELHQIRYVQEEMKTLYQDVCAHNALLRSKLTVAESVFNSEQRDSSLRIHQDMVLREELSACFQREAMYKAELLSTRKEVLQLTPETEEFRTCTA